VQVPFGAFTITIGSAVCTVTVASVKGTRPSPGPGTSFTVRVRSWSHAPSLRDWLAPAAR
jgi:hypothetical protein